jgi:hypothetical protein
MTDVFREALRELPPAVAARVLKCSVTTLRNLVDRGELTFTVSPSGHRRYDVGGYLERRAGRKTKAKAA